MVTALTIPKRSQRQDCQVCSCVTEEVAIQKQQVIQAVHWITFFQLMAGNWTSYCLEQKKYIYIYPFSLYKHHGSSINMGVPCEFFVGVLLIGESMNATSESELERGTWIKSFARLYKDIDSIGILKIRQCIYFHQHRSTMINIIPYALFIIIIIIIITIIMKPLHTLAQIPRGITPHWSANSRWSCERSSFSYACSRCGASLRDRRDTLRGFKGREGPYVYRLLQQLVFRKALQIDIQRVAFFPNDDLRFLVRTVRGKHK